MKDLKDKVVVITGAAKGIGFQIAMSFAKEKAIPILIDLNKELLETAANKIKEKGFLADYFEGNVVDSSQMNSVFKEIVSKYNKIDVLINNAGIAKDNIILRMKEEEWDNVINVNLKGTFICSQIATKIMLKQRHGVLVNISSVIGIMGNIGQANYSASKGGVISFTKSCAKEFASKGIRVNAIAPGFIETEMTKILSKETIEKYQASIPLKRMGSVEDVANLCLFLSSEKSSYITGQVINVDGGLVM